MEKEKLYPEEEMMIEQEAYKSFLDVAEYGKIGTMPYCKKNVSEGMLLDVQENTLAQAAKPIDKHKNKKATPQMRRSFFTRTQISVL